MKVFSIAVLVALLFILGTSGDEIEDRCGDNTETRQCGPPEGCQKSCENRYRGLNCLPVCDSGCYCQGGYVRQFTNGPCILESECPPLATPTRYNFHRY